METTSIDESAVRVSTDSHIGAEEAARVRAAVVRLARLAPRPVLSARVRLTRHGDPAVVRPVVALARRAPGARVGGRPRTTSPRSGSP